MRSLVEPSARPSRVQSSCGSAQGWKGDPSPMIRMLNSRIDQGHCREGSHAPKSSPFCLRRCCPSNASRLTPALRPPLSRRRHAPAELVAQGAIEAVVRQPDHREMRLTAADDQAIAGTEWKLHLAV